MVAFGVVGAKSKDTDVIIAGVLPLKPKDNLLFMEIALKFTAISNKRLYKAGLIALLLVCVLSLLPSAITFADELGGYISEKLIGSSLTGNSEFVIGTTGNGGYFDIVRDEGEPRTHMNVGEPAFQINSLIPLVFMGSFIILLLMFAFGGQESGLALVVIVAVILYVFYSFLTNIQQIITGFLGG